MFRIDDRGVLRVAEWSRHDWLSHGFSTRGTGDFTGRPPDAQVKEAFGFSGSSIATLKQIHSDIVMRTDSHSPQERPAADALTTDRSGQLLGIRTADCVPVLMIDPSRVAVAAVHAGWRGVAARIVSCTVNRMSQWYGSRPNEIECAIGPGISRCCFEVGEEVAEEFADAFVDRSDTKPHVDLIATVQSELAGAGVRRVFTVGECTVCNPQKYFSHRGERGNTGRMLSVAGIETGGV